MVEKVPTIIAQLRSDFAAYPAHLHKNANNVTGDNVKRNTLFMPCVQTHCTTLMYKVPKNMGWYCNHLYSK